MLPLVLSYAGGCGRGTQPRSRDEIFRERCRLPALFIGEKSGARIVAPGDCGKLLGPDGKEIYWRAKACMNPQCPGRDSDGTPYLFPEPDGMSYIAPDGSIAVDPARVKVAPSIPGCPMCWPLRSRSETPQERQKYTDWVETYVLPETAAKLKALDEEYRLRTEFDTRKRRDAK